MSDPNVGFTESIPPIYDEFLGPVFFEPYAVDLAGRLAGLREGRVLELAAGTGILTRCLRDALPSTVEIVATDLNGAMLERAKPKFTTSERVAFSVADATKLPFADESFDAVACQFGIMFFPDKPASLRECLRVLRPGGSLLFNVWDSLEHNDLARIADDAVRAAFPADPPTFYHTPYGCFDVESISSMVAAAGFEAGEHAALSLPGNSPSALASAKGIVEGTPMSNEIRRRDPAAIAAIVAAVERELIARFGGPDGAKMRAIVFAAKRPSH